MIKGITPQDHFFLMYGKCDCNFDDVIEEYKCRVANAKDSSFWKECLIIAKEFKKKQDNEQ
jgi:hypothetical protein